ncbi:MAG: hypothetical protein MI924_12635, partial [Chloroflexales bacterium]|nr:hypothetical protein [Chloroflexales bacterium]
VAVGTERPARRGEAPIVARHIREPDLVQVAGKVGGVRGAAHVQGRSLGRGGQTGRRLGRTVAEDLRRAAAEGHRQVIPAVGGQGGAPSRRCATTCGRGLCYTLGI